MSNSYSLDSMTINDLATMSLDEFSASSFYSCDLGLKDFPRQFAARIAAPLSRPTGRWADFNKAWRYRKGLEELANQGLFNRQCLPPYPDPADYSDTTLPPSDAFR